MPNVEETKLPGIGVRHDFTLRSGARVGVVTHKTGRRELLVYNERDPDACSEQLRLEEDEGHTLADLLGGTTISERVEEVQQRVEGLAIDWLTVKPGSSAAGEEIAKVGRRRTGVSLVAIIRNGETMQTPGGDFRLEVGDTAVVVGTVEGIQAFAAIARGEA